MRRTCRRVILRTGEIETEVHYGITSLGRDLAGPRELEFFWRGHWTIENCDHYVRDETLGEDRPQTHTGNAPQVLAALRNGLLALLRYPPYGGITKAGVISPPPYVTTAHHRRKHCFSSDGMQHEKALPIGTVSFQPGNER